MENLLKPDIGLMFWTFVNFGVLVFLLAKIAWKPMLKILRQRDENIKQSLMSAEATKNDAEKIHREIELKLKNLSVKESEIIQNARKMAETQSEKLLDEARVKAKEFTEKAKKDLTSEKEKLSEQLKKEVADISVMVAGKIISKEIDKSANRRFVDKFLKDLSKKKA